MGGRARRCVGGAEIVRLEAKEQKNKTPRATPRAAPKIDGEEFCCRKAPRCYRRRRASLAPFAPRRRLGGLLAHSLPPSRPLPLPPSLSPSPSLPPSLPPSPSLPLPPSLSLHPPPSLHPPFHHALICGRMALARTGGGSECARTAAARRWRCSLACGRGAREACIPRGAQDRQGSRNQVRLRGGMDEA